MMFVGKSDDDYDGGGCADDDNNKYNYNKFQLPFLRRKFIPI